MRKRILAFVLAGAMALSMTGCGGGSSEDSSAAASGDQKTIDGNVLDADQSYTTYLMSDPTTLDAVKGNDTYSNSILLNIMEPLTRMDEDADGKNTRIGAGAESWESNEDGTVWTFHLRDMKWSDGEPVTAADYAYSLTMALDPEAGSPNSYLVTCIKNGEAVNSGEKDVSELGVKAVDDKTLEITLEEPTPYFLAMTDTRIMMPTRQDVFEKYGESYGADADKIIGNGPFKLESWTHNSEIKLVKNEEYWDAENVNLQSVTYQIQSEETTNYNSFDNGTLDACTCGTQEWMERFEAKDNVERYDYVSAAVRFHFFNTKDELFKNENIRKAFSLAIDREDVVDTIYLGAMYATYGWVPEGVTMQDGTDYREKVEAPLKAMYESEDPKELLLKGMEELGLGDDPSTLTVKFTLGGTTEWLKKYGEYFQQKYKEVLGVNIELDSNEWGTFQSKTNSGDYQMAYMSWTIDYNDPDGMLSLMTSDSNAIPTFWSNEEYDEIMAQASVEMDDAKRLELFQQAEKILFESGGPLAPVVNEGVHGFYYNYVHNLGKTPFNTMGLKKIYISGR